VHPGGPFWAARDDGAWSIPKGEVEEGEEPLAAALREFTEETGAAPPSGPFHPLGSVRQAGGKIVEAWAVRADFDPTTLRSATFEVVWPPRSGRRETFPEVDRAAWWDLPAARKRIVQGQVELLERLGPALGGT
jgi:predicted NUDIX family NTP pyrophosphohydrolase